jgi:hypothetical protein
MLTGPTARAPTAEGHGVALGALVRHLAQVAFWVLEKGSLQARA